MLSRDIQQAPYQQSQRATGVGVDGRRHHDETRDSMRISDRQQGRYLATERVAYHDGALELMDLHPGVQDRDELAEVMVSPRVTATDAGKIRDVETIPAVEVLRDRLEVRSRDDQPVHHQDWRHREIALRCDPGEDPVAIDLRDAAHPVAIGPACVGQREPSDRSLGPTQPTTSRTARTHQSTISSDTG